MTPGLSHANTARLRGTRPARRVGRWTQQLAVGNILATATGAIAVVWLLVQGQLIVPDLSEHFADVFGGAD